MNCCRLKSAYIRFWKVVISLLTDTNRNLAGNNTTCCFSRLQQLFRSLLIELILIEMFRLKLFEQIWHIQCHCLGLLAKKTLPASVAIDLTHTHLDSPRMFDQFIYTAEIVNKTQKHFIPRSEIISMIRLRSNSHVHLSKNIAAAARISISISFQRS